MTARVATAAETVACERVTIVAGTSARELMERAGRAAADEIVRRFRLALPAGVVVFTGPGNNGGDGWVVARCLAEYEFPVTVIEAAEPKTDEARAAEDSVGKPEIAEAVTPASVGEAPIIIDALLGTGATGAPRGTVASAIEIVNNAKADGAVVISLDVPSGLDTTTGEHELCVQADVTITFGVVKRGHLLARDVCGEIVCLDIGLTASRELESLPLLVDRYWVSERVPEIPPDAHKGTRRRLVVVAGGEGMAGAAILSGTGALRSGIGLVRLVVAGQNTVAIHVALPASLVKSWPTDPSALEEIMEEADAFAMGPGMGRSREVRDLVERVLIAWAGPVVVDADALSVFENDAASLAKLLRGRPAVITPHPMEFARLIGRDTKEVLKNRFEIGADFAREAGATVLLKGAPTIIFAPEGNRFISAAGTAALATGGSGDVLTGIVGTMLAQLSGDRSSAEIAAISAFVHGRAAELAGPVRGTTLEDILLALPDAWNEHLEHASEPFLVCLPPVP
jgi:NAD(P)H-hydrate epimerase